MRELLFIVIFSVAPAMLPAQTWRDSVVVRTACDSASREVLRDAAFAGLCPDSVSARPDSIQPKRIRVNGFRVQVYSGGGNQNGKLQARRMADKVKIWFEGLPVYTSFSSPRWLCRVGDFQTREEAMELLQLMRETKQFPMAIIVKSKVNITEDELKRD
ncbi:MAG: SPOR domain-containing protein [Bacteroidaceae bacterium]|nr:SPOR domain-containing protein [Bacteroidaceae bacterium]